WSAYNGKVGWGLEPVHQEPQNAKSDRLDTMAAGVADLTPISGGVAAARYHRRAGAIDNARAGRDGLRGGVRRAGNLWPLRNDRTAAGLCRIWPGPHPGPGTGFIVGRGHPRRRSAIVCW